MLLFVASSALNNDVSGGFDPKASYWVAGGGVMRGWGWVNDQCIITALAHIVGAVGDIREMRNITLKNDRARMVTNGCCVVGCRG